ncbi:MAG: hypothetical protein WC519_00700 [Parcubacteria group bacterium]
MKVKKKFLKIYTEFLSHEIKTTREMRVVFDASNGFAGAVMKETIKKERHIKPTFINCRPSARFSAHGPNPIAPHATDELSRKVIEQKADLGFIFDGDGDRVILIDDRGAIVHPDFVAKFYAEHYAPKKIIVDRRMGWLVTKDLISERPITIIKSKVGHLHVKETMKRNNAGFGVEASGHYYFHVEGTYIDSGAIMALKMITAVSQISSFAEWISRGKTYPKFGEESFPATEPDGIIERVKNYAERRGFKLDLEDGLAAERDDFHFVIRKSANEPLMRMNAEATDEGILKKEVQMIQSLINKKSI